MYGKYRAGRKSQVFDCDGFLQVIADGAKGRLMDSTGAVLATVSIPRGVAVESGIEFSHFGRVISVDEPVKTEDVQSGATFLPPQGGGASLSHSSSSSPGTSSTTTTANGGSGSGSSSRRGGRPINLTVGSLGRSGPAPSPGSGSSSFLSSTATSGAVTNRRLFHVDPRQSRALLVSPGLSSRRVVLDRAFFQEERTLEPGDKVLRSCIVLESRLGQKALPHQVEGIRFLYAALSGFDGRAAAAQKWQRLLPELCVGGKGAILADDLGFGKTFTAIATIWTLLVQGDLMGESVARALVLVPASLALHWQTELRRWLGPTCESRNCAVLSTPDSLKNLNFSKRRIFVLTYEMFRRHIAAIDMHHFGIVIADEGHRLRNRGSGVYKAIRRLRAPRILLISGTPVQNKLLEFFVLADLARPGSLGDEDVFKNVFVDPIAAGSTGGSDAGRVELAARRSQELNMRILPFFLRRSKMILVDRSEFILCCPFTMVQRALYRYVLASRAVAQQSRGRSTSGAVDVAALAALHALQYVCDVGHPPGAVTGGGGGGGSGGGGGGSGGLERDEGDDDVGRFFRDTHSLRGLVAKEVEGIGESGETGWTTDRCMAVLTTDMGRLSAEDVLKLSSKFHVLNQLLQRFVDDLDEKVVVVASTMCVLTCLEVLLKANNRSYLRLDGSVATGTRKQRVDQFNTASHPSRVFLLSKKAGGEGLNLVGARRLVMFDSSWNPSVDRQACGRVHRFGQDRRVYVYRLVCAGSLEEKIVQRQLFKEGMDHAVKGHLSSVSGGGGDGVRPTLSREDLMEVFQYRADSICDTAEALVLSLAEGSSCDGCGRVGAGSRVRGGSRVGRALRAQRLREAAQLHENRIPFPNYGAVGSFPSEEVCGRLDVESLDITFILDLSERYTGFTPTDERVDSPTTDDEPAVDGEEDDEEACRGAAVAGVGDDDVGSLPGAVSIGGGIMPSSQSSQEEAL